MVAMSMGDKKKIDMLKGWLFAHHLFENIIWS